LEELEKKKAGGREETKNARELRKENGDTASLVSMGVIVWCRFAESITAFQLTFASTRETTVRCFEREREVGVWGTIIFSTGMKIVGGGHGLVQSGRKVPRG